MKSGREAAERRGRRAEQWAIWYLRFKGFRIREKRYRTPVGEIDLIASRGKLLIFVEVKARATVSEAALAISASQQKRIQRAAEHFLATNSGYEKSDIRFDAILISPRRWPGHLAGAWRS
jgi:putative endonuclease